MCEDAFCVNFGMFFILDVALFLIILINYAGIKNIMNYYYHFMPEISFL